MALFGITENSKKRELQLVNVLVFNDEVCSARLPRKVEATSGHVTDNITLQVTAITCYLFVL